MSPALLGAWLAVSFGAWIALHLALAIGLGRRSWWRGLLALFLPPLALAWGWRAGMRGRLIAYVGSLGAYALGVLLSA